ncbi:MAG: UDP-N-acetylglucosamine 2-epimerase (non-hydrolyzing) [Bacteroidales bacterium]|jgi:UDP-N-acetylglucosamine 2-epimerase (non-hydrolysing)|nr:UDP-N-acetylglucosamine 2-epimerase (non-hydrolyzing) [Bacteroidales bacterium]
MIKVLSVVGARPNFIKIAPLHREFLKYSGVKNYMCHTGQHFDDKMSKVFFDELKMPRPDFWLGVGGGSHAIQTAGIITGFEKVVTELKPDLVVVLGDVNSTMSAALVASKAGIPIAHIESGLRSNDRTMPEEINRMVTDVLSDYLFVSEKSGIENLRKEGISEDKIFFVGNIMIDSLVEHLPDIEKSEIISHLGIAGKKYCLCTFHRPSNVDSADRLKSLTGLLNELSEKLPVVFPVHPRTRQTLERTGGGMHANSNLIFTEPLGYLDFLHLVKNAELIITDSGGIQAEATFLQVQCITARDNTESMATVDIGTNQLIGTDVEKNKKAAFDIISGNKKQGHIPELWDGRTAERIVGILSERYGFQLR